MTQTNIAFCGADGTTLEGLIVYPNEKPKAILQFTHGMTEHVGRYEDFASKLAESGIIFAGFDLRGHGKYQAGSKVASFGVGGWEKSIEDMHVFYNILHEKFPDVPYFLLGFSLGSFLAREYVSRYSDPLSGVIIMGTSEQPAFVISIMMKIVQREINKGGFNKTTPKVRKLAFENYNKNFMPNRTSADWLCADEDELDKYLKDPLCCTDISSGLFWQMLGSMKRTSKDNYKNWDKDMPVLLISGGLDPVGNNGKCIITLYDKMKKAGLNVEKELFGNARHDLLHEYKTDAYQAMLSLLNWIKAHCY